MSNPFGGIGAICVSKNLGRCTQTSLLSHYSFLITHNSLLMAHPRATKNPPSLVRRRGKCYEDCSLHYLICQPAALAMRLGISVLSIRPVNNSAPAPMAKQGT